MAKSYEKALSVGTVMNVGKKYLKERMVKKQKENFNGTAPRKSKEK